MSSLEILRALQAGSISAEEAKQALAKKTLPNVNTGYKQQFSGHHKDAIAIIGMSGRYPEAKNLEEYWLNIESGKNSISEIPLSRWDVSQYYDPRPFQKGKVYCKWLGMLDDIAQFDPLFFALSPNEAEWMDPQHRIFLQEAYKAFEDAGYSDQELSNKKCGVYLGIMSNEYGSLLSKSENGISGATGNSYSIAAARIAYFLNLKGPALAIDTACSSSLTATHLACQALLNHEIDMALTGGVNLYLTPESYISMCSGGMLSKDGQCKTFDNSADGFVPGEGVGALVLKRLADAEADHDFVYGLIIGSGINQDGKTNGITAPSVSSQMELERDVYKKFTIHPESISYVEMHGTGTKLGDPIELEALSTVFQEQTAKKNFCGLGSVKSNIGHTSAAAGIASVQKVLLSMKYKKLAPTLNVNHPNEHFDFEASPFYINKTLKPWDTPAGKYRRAGVSSFGFSGTNAHLVIEEYPSDLRMARPDKRVLFVLSAASNEQLIRYATNIKEYIVANEEINLSDMAYTLQVGRQEMEHRFAFIVVSRETASDILEEFIRTGVSSGTFIGKVQTGAARFLQNITTERLKELFEAEALEEIARFWVNGVMIKWSLLYGKNKPYRMSLPTYPFAPEEYWVPVPDRIINSSSVTTNTVRPAKENYRPVFLEKHWLRDTTVPTMQVNGTVAILSVPSTVDLAVEISKRFIDSEIIQLKDAIIPAVAEPEAWKKYRGVIDLTGCGIVSSLSNEWMVWLQHLIEYGSREGLMFLGVTKGLEPYENPSINLSGASSAGLYKILQNEYKYLQSKNVDLELNETDQIAARLIETEFKTGTEYPEVCIRKSKRYHSVLQESTQIFNVIPGLVFPTGQVLWITGGTSGIGYQCAVHFVKQHGVKKVVLTGRTKIPPREEWEQFLKSGHLLSGKIKAIQALENLGAQVVVLSVSLTNAIELKNSLDEIKRTMGAIGGVIHSAGITDRENPAFIRKNWPGVTKVLEVKVDAVNTLYESFKEEPLQFFALFSSVAAAIPVLGAGQSDYVMANAYMDYFAMAQKPFYPVVSIQWPSWKETGFGEVKSKPYADTGLLSHTNEEGLLLLDQILGNLQQAVILPAYVNAVNWTPELLKQLPAVVTTSSLETNADPLTVAEKWLTDLIARELKIDPSRLQVDKEFQLYGIDSIILAQLVSKIDHGLRNIHLDPSALIEHPTIKRLSEYLIMTHPTAIAELRETREEADDFSTFGKLNNTQLSERQIEKQKNVSKNEESENKIAVIGMACHFPDAADISEYWNNLKSGNDSVREVPATRWDWKKYYDPVENREGKSSSKWGAFLPAIEEFDPVRFKITESLAPYIDPIQRQWLEVSTEAISDAGYDKETLWGKKVGVFAGARTGNFGFKFNGHVKDRIIGVGQNFITAHLAHIFNFKGPNLVVDTACSSSLTAIHLAVKSLKNGESEIALAGGVDILLDEGVFVGLSEARILSPQGRCQTFSADANGIGLGEGCGVLVLKSLENAIRDNDKIYGVIDGSAVNNDGNTMGVTTPNPDAQRDLVESAISDANIKAATISYIEAHGTGTLIGDPIELKALTKVFNAHTEEKQFCGVGSVKSNIGHLLSASGAASMIKVLLSLVHGQLPPTLHCSNPNPRFNFDESPLYLVQQLQNWKARDQVLRAGISSFGLGGNNAHIIISNEGIPDSHKAGLEPKISPVPFHRKRYWPQEAESGHSEQEAAAFNNSSRIDDPEENDFMRLFEIKEIRNDA